MKKGEILLMFVIILLAVFIIAFLSKYSTLTISRYPSRLVGDESREFYTLDISPQQMVSGEFIRIGKNDLIKFTIDGKKYSLEVYELNSNIKEVKIFDENLGTISLKEYQSQKMNIDSDDYYDLEIRISSVGPDNAYISIKQINEKISFINLVDLKIEDLMMEYNKNYRTQFNIIIIILAMLFIFMVFYIIKNSLIPYLRFKRKTSKEKPESTIEYFLEELERQKSKNSRAEVKKLFARIKHLYSYLSPDEKRRFKNKLKKIENYLKSD